MLKWEDALLPDKYDQNFFECSAQPTKEEFRQAVEYQQKLGLNYIKLESDEPLTDCFGLESGVTLTMALKTDGENRKTNPDLEFHTPSKNELEEIEVKHFASVYGEDFTRRNVRRMYEKLTYHGAYLDGKLVGACYSFSTDGVTAIDGLIVDEAFRKRYIATSLIAEVKRAYPDTVLFLHADEDDTPKDMYKKMGFETVDRLYEYLSTDIANLPDVKNT